MEVRSKKTAAVAAAIAAFAGGGAAIANAAGAFDGDESYAGPNADRARAAALRATGGGTATAVELDSEHGATYEVEVTRPDGSNVDVRLDEQLGVVAIEGDSEDASEQGEDEREEHGGAGDD